MPQSTTPKYVHILSYEDIFDGIPPENRIELIKNIDRTTLMAEIAAINYRLRPRDLLYTDQSVQTQEIILQQFCLLNPQLLRFCKTNAAKYMRHPKDYPLFFTRATCLFALEEISQSEINIVEDFSMALSEHWENLLKYLLAVNGEITKTQHLEENSPVTIMQINASMIALNELNIDTDIMPIPYRGYRLINYLSAQPDTNPYVKEYFNSTYNVDIEYFLFETMGMLLANNSGNRLHNFFYRVNQGQTELFEKLSGIVENITPFKLLTLRKFPFYKAADDTFILSDITFLIEKTYQQFINDFWFDCLRNLTDTNGKSIFKPQDYWSIIGGFFETYVGEILHHIFDVAKYYKILLFDDLKLIINKQTIEIADVYLRYTDKILIGEVKATTVFDDAKYSGTAEGFVRNNPDRFYKDFGVAQTIDHIKNVELHIDKVDPGFQAGKTYHIYPVIVVNDKVLQTPMIAHIFNLEFSSRLKEINFTKMKVFPLTLIHISDLERMQDALYQNPNYLWKILQRNAINSVFIPPLYHTLNLLNIKSQYLKCGEFYKELISKYNPVTEENNVEMQTKHGSHE